MYLSKLLHRNLDSPIELIIKSLQNIPIQFIRNAGKCINETIDEMYWEITDRIVNFDYIPPQQRPYIDEILEELSKRAEQSGIIEEHFDSLEIFY